MTNPMRNETELPIACDLTAIPLSERTEHVSVSLHIFEQAEQVQELPTGYAFRFANEPGLFMQLAQFVGNERRCCQFFAFGIELEPGGGPLWLRLTGGEGVKDFVQATFGDMTEAVG